MPEGKFPDQGRLSMHKHPSMVGDVCESWPSADLLTVLIGRSFRLPDTGRGFLPTQDSDISDACSSGARRSRRVIHRQPARRAVDHPKHTPQAEKLRGYFCRHHRLDHPSRPSHPGDFLPTSAASTDTQHGGFCRREGIFCRQDSCKTAGQSRFFAPPMYLFRARRAPRRKRDMRPMWPAARAGQETCRAKRTAARETPASSRHLAGAVS